MLVGAFAPRSDAEKLAVWSASNRLSRDILKLMRQYEQELKKSGLDLYLIRAVQCNGLKTARSSSGL